jgi:hypothetical protein
MEKRKPKVGREREKMKITFPVLKKKPVWPSKPRCPWCKRNKVMEPHSMAILAGGAMQVVEAKKKSATIADDCIGFLDLIWHGAHDGGSGANREICARTPLFADLMLYVIHV